MEELLQKLADMKHPSIEKILRKNGYDYEADLIAKIIEKFENERN